MFAFGAQALCDSGEMDRRHRRKDELNSQMLTVHRVRRRKERATTVLLLLPSSTENVSSQAANPCVQLYAHENEEVTDAEQ
jgi:hypothetical protein